MSMKLLVNISVGSVVIDLLPTNLYVRQILEKKWEYKGTVNQLFIEFKKAYDSIKRD
jgi:hypothetical protein